MKTTLVGMVWALSLGWSGAALAVPTTATLTPTADARVVQSWPGLNFGTGYLATTGKTNAKIESVLEFQVSGVTFPVASAKLRLYATLATPAGPSVYATSSTWNEMTMNWTNRVLAVGSASAAAGAIAKNTWVEFNVLPLVAANGAVSFKLQQTGTSEVDFQSREQTNKPQLVLTWDSACAGQPNGTACSDGNACTSGDSCKANVCVGGAAVVCSDGNICTTDTCSTATGCVFTNNTVACNADNNACTPDICASGVCQVGTAKVCNDNVACTIDSCDTVTGNCVFKTTSGCQNDTIIAKGSLWKYLVTGSNPANNWNATAFNDTTWKSGKAALGYGVTGLTTTLGYGNKATSKDITTYFRNTFTLIDPSVYTSLALTCRRNDGVVVYLNGHEIFRDNMPTGTISHTTLASTAVTDTTYWERYIDPSLLVTGKNVIAVEVHLASASDATLAFDLDLTRRCPVKLGDPALETIETLCDGLDNDCDGITDLLMPVAANACTTGLAGECGKGYSACMPEGKSCLAPPPVAETRDGLDNDCNGATDDAATGVALPVRVRVILPTGMGGDTPDVLAGTVEMLNALGVPATVPDLTTTNVYADWAAAFDELNNYSLVLMPGYLIGGSIAPDQMTKLENWVLAGGILVWIKPSDPGMLAFGGASDTAQHLDTTRIAVTANNPATLYLDSLEERSILISNNPANTPGEVFTYTLSGTGVAFGTAMGAAGAIGPSLLRNAYGQGAVYTLGFDPLGYADTRCYINCFEPGRDILTQIMRGAFRESAHGHYALKHTVPGTEASAVILTHDMCADDAQNTNVAWGTAGSLQMANMEVGKGVRGSYTDQTDYPELFYNPALIGQLCALGMCPEGNHSVLHVDMTNIALGDCTVTSANYDTTAPTMCGELVVAGQLMEEQLPAGSKIVYWRAPFLGVNSLQYDTLAAQGYLYDSSYAIGDLRSNYPISVARYPQMQFKFHGARMWTLPLALEDGIGTIDGGVVGRIELQRMNEPWFLANWTYAMLQNRANHAWTVQLVHPSYGLGVGPENLPLKIEAVQKYITKYQAYGDVLTDLVVPLGEFWRARDAVRLAVNYDPVYGYSGTITTGPLGAPHFSMEFGDSLASFSCNGGGTPTIVGNRVVLPTALAPNMVYTFAAPIL